MRNQFLIDTIQRSSREPNGCGMSTRPEFYSGRGAISSDLNGRSLEVIYAAIEKNVNKAAADEYAKMVRDIPVLSATDFLITLAHFEANNWVWDEKLANKGGTAISDIGSLFGTMMSDSSRDETVYIRADFLRSHGLKETREDGKGLNKYGYPDCDYDRYYRRYR